MKSFTEYLWFNTRHIREFINITPEVKSIVEKSGIQEGFVLVSAMHITAGVYVNDAEEGLIADIEEWLEKLAPARPDYRHHQTGETKCLMRLKRVCSFTMKSSFLLPMVSWISVPGNKYIMQSLMGSERRGLL